MNHHPTRSQQAITLTHNVANRWRRYFMQQNMGDNQVKGLVWEVSAFGILLRKMYPLS
jgi:hypothetical protein